MSLKLFLKILIAVSCCYAYIHIIYVNDAINKAIAKEMDAHSPFKVGVCKDSTERRIKRAEQRLDLKNKIAALEAKKYPVRVQFLGLILMLIGTWAGRSVIATLFKKRLGIKKPMQVNNFQHLDGSGV